MNTIGIDHNLDRPRIRKLLTMGLFASVLTGIGDFLLSQLFYHAFDQKMVYNISISP
jgi:hypothetical protein